MKILVTSMIDLETSAHNRLHQFLDYLSQNHEITVVSINDGWKKEYECNDNKHPDDFLGKHPKISVIHYTDKHISPMIQEVVSSFHMKSVLKNLDLSSFDVHYNYNGLCGGYAITKLLKKYNVPSVYDIADNLPAMIKTSPQLSKPLQIAGGIYGNSLYKKNIRYSDKVTVTTKGLGEVSHVPAEKQVILPNGVDINLFYPQDKCTVRNKLHLEDVFTIGYVGVLREWVDFSGLFKAATMLKNKYALRLLIVGNGPDMEATKKLATSYNVADITTFTGNIPYAMVPDYISAMDVCTIPFKTDQVAKDSLPLKLFEYMACERPVISSKIDIIVEQMSEYVHCVESAEEYMSVLETYLKNPERKTEDGRKGKQFTAENYTWESISKHLEQTLIGVQS